MDKLIAGAPADLSAGISLERSFGTWSSDYPNAMTWLPLGLIVTPVAYAESTGKATDFPAGQDIRFGRHALNASTVQSSLQHAGTSLDWSYSKQELFSVQGQWSTTSFGEWGLRFWVCLALWAEGGQRWHWDTELEAAVVQAGHRYGVLTVNPSPLLTTGHESIVDLTIELEAHGYFFLESRSNEAPLLALRFNLEEAPSAQFGFAIGDDLNETLTRAKLAMSLGSYQSDELPVSTKQQETNLQISSNDATEVHALENQISQTLPSQTIGSAGALDAVNDIVAWNTVFDNVNQRPYTVLSRNWTTQKFGGFGVWLNDVLLSALLCNMVDAQSARDNLLAVMAGATPQGNLPCLLTGNDAWIDRSQPPIAAYVTMMCHLRNPDRPLLQRVVPLLQRAYAWWWQSRDPEHSGLVRYGTSAIGSGLYRGTKLAAKDESGMDNSPIHDEANIDTETGLLDSYDVGLNALLALEGELLSALLKELGRNDEAQALEQQTTVHKKAIRTRLWDESRQVFANRLTNGKFVRSLAPTSFYPMIAGIPTSEQSRLLLDHLKDENGFGGQFRLPSTRRDDPAFADNVYWRGRVWPPMNYFTWAGLRRAGCHSRSVELAAELAAESFALFNMAWKSGRIAAENYSAVDGTIDDQPDTDTFYAWSALMPSMAVAEIIDVTPWEGFTLTNGADVKLGPVVTPNGPCSLEILNANLRLIQDTSALLETNIPGRLRHLSMRTDRLRLQLPDNAIAGQIIIPALSLPVLALQGDQAIDTQLQDGRLVIHTRSVLSDEDRAIDVVLP